MKETELLILGAGPAGLAAAIEAVKAGSKVTLVDENPFPGGQIYRQFDRGFKVSDAKVLGRDFGRGQKLLAEFERVRDRVDYFSMSTVWGIFPNNEVTLLLQEQSQRIRFQKLIVAAGAYDRPVPFPGWTLPGVFTAGGAQRLVKTQRVLPGEKILLAGSGPLQLALANQIVDAGGNVEAIAEAGTIENWFRLIHASRGQWQLIADALKYIWGIRRAGIPMLRGHIIVEARGEQQVEEAVIAEVDENWRPKPGRQRTLIVDTVCVGYGFTPSTGITRLAKCEHQYDPLQGGWLPVRGKNMETSNPDIYAAGDCTGIAGSMAAIDEGRIAGIAASCSLEKISPTEADRRAEPSRQRLASRKPLLQVLNEISMPRPGLFELATDDTIVCRCEEIRLREISEVLLQGAVSMNEVKRLTRMGMGNCQGRMCAPALQEIIALQKKMPPADLGSLTPRPPLCPVPLQVLQES
ncbi:MAG: FAD-dependent oxidoreductase [SAR324 cluster bacterium]|nr:FAD-dependent oxidoreductase [SAR324 cluster bacterium]